ncbi:50S ribosomal protein L25/general stress protein Ctc [Coxiella endosymbiont of Amblyomma americanum]|uniref:50S ribosomal protein L25/general stress protein Ctc n=1 Tax=Coxiella endosymbiont of Amblyomma americanum TaxID=325775 RepID=UPI00057EEA88|nr:50S ribosomal protein L25/general stress protein Ctc [Coxiella endosymbiont of Amblyomma americanum]AJC50198.1 50S ribosomal protein L25 [Coxiella endosymbiont of Amblyomma americanum]AUJ58559.1 50S ribosomal protein L25/general stress protein Ctc [Coxiella-like endosymbiont of Amblyomma americanum]
MVIESFEFQAELRRDVGTRAARRIRRLHNGVLGTVYGAGKIPQSIVLTQKDVLKAFENEATFASVLTLKIDNQEQKVVLKDLQRHHTKPNILHVDFQRIKASEKITMRVPLHIVGREACVGIKAGGMISHLQTDVEVRCFPADLPEYIEIDISALDLDTSLHISDLKLPHRVELTTAVESINNVPVVNIHLPRASKADIEAEAHEEDNLSAQSEKIMSNSSELSK